MLRFVPSVLAGALLLTAGIATSANATTFVGNYEVGYDHDPDGLLEIATQDLTPGAGGGFSFDLSTVGQTAIVNLFDIWTPATSAASASSDERRVGNACVSTCRSRWCP